LPASSAWPSWWTSKAALGHSAGLADEMAA
jgi:hypothetical protein